MIEQCRNHKTRFRHRSSAKSSGINPARFSIVWSRLGDPALPDTDLGPVVSARAAKRIGEMIDDAMARGCRIISTGPSKGGTIHPTIVVDPPGATRLIRKEVFGPVVVVMRADDIDDAIRIANNCDCGSQGSCFTSNLSSALRMSEEIPVG
jgi:acyl-CoA reductase-like NAD-dependent aldehyde dehydrogenase